MQLPLLDWRLVAAVTLLMVSISVSADTRVVEVWTCTLNEGKSAEDLNAINAGRSLDYAYPGHWLTPPLRPLNIVARWCAELGLDEEARFYHRLERERSSFR